MVQKRSIPLCIVFSIITCGIYGLYWFVMLTDEANLASGKQDTSGGMCLLFTIITCGIYGIYWAYKMGDKMEIIRAAAGRPSGNLPILYLLLNLVGLSIITYALAQNELNQTLPA